MPTSHCSSGEADRLSLLPDDILDHILFFVPHTEEKARTSLLSKRFRHLWLYHPSIRLGSSTPDLMPLDDSDPESAAAITRYVRSVDACLSSSFRSSTLRTLDLRLVDCSRTADRWILFAAARSVRSLHLWSLDRYPKVPRTIFCCQALTSLRLDCRARDFPLDACACFPSLVDLNLSSCHFSDQTLTLLLSKCPALRTLTLYCCDYLEVLHLSSKTLSKVKISSCDDLKSVILDTPNLLSISFRGRVDILRVKNTPHLVHASIREDYDQKPATASPIHLSSLIEDVRHVSRRLKVTAWPFNAPLPKNPNAVFSNLKELCCQMTCLTAPTLSSLVSMLRRSPNLEKLDLDLCFRDRYYWSSSHRIHDGFDMTTKGKSERCLGHLMEVELLAKKLIKEIKDDQKREVWDQSKAMELGLEDDRHSLKFVLLRKFLGTANEMKMIEYLLGTESALETLIIHDTLMRDEEKIAKLLDHIPRASPHVQIYKKQGSYLRNIDGTTKYLGKKSVTGFN